MLGKENWEANPYEIALGMKGWKQQSPQGTFFQRSACHPAAPTLT